MPGGEVSESFQLAITLERFTASNLLSGVRPLSKRASPCGLIQTAFSIQRYRSPAIRLGLGAVLRASVRRHRSAQRHPWLLRSITPKQVSTPQRHHRRSARGDGAQRGPVRARCWLGSSVNGDAAEQPDPRLGPTQPGVEKTVDELLVLAEEPVPERVKGRGQRRELRAGPPNGDTVGPQLGTRCPLAARSHGTDSRRVVQSRWQSACLRWQ
jgi:hypothetical protein